MGSDFVPSNKHYLDRQAGFESNARSYPRRLPLAIRSACGVTVTDVEGKDYIDCLAGAGTLALGHNHPVVVEAIRKHLTDGLPLHTLDLTSPTKDRFVHELFATLPPSFAARARIQFCGPTGADAIEASLKLVKTATGRRSILAFRGGYHGQSHGTLAMMGNVGPKAPITGLMPDVHFLPYPYQYRCPLAGRACANPCDCTSLAGYVERMLDDPESGIPPAAGMVLEVVQGEGGSIPAPDGWLRDIRRITRERKIPLILDEIQTGWGRTGKLYAFEHSGIVPDVLVLSKAIGGGLPLSVIVYDKDLDQWAPGAHAGTFRGNVLGMTAGLATLKFLRENDLPAHAAKMGDRLRTGICELQKRHAIIGDVRGRGLMIGVEIVDSAGNHDGPKARRIQEECFRRGLIVEVGGRYSSVLRFLPPLIVTPNDIDAILERLAGACGAVTEK